ncbi:ABC-type nitrate/sulfonate/bicarbonate transport system, permease component [Microbacterium testaceum StLB037]|uniref:ABC-type nitrate/sulfonate/bicarbonate transport system, permease component n=1 Tax=Microbacterium testaceum (strain StLB037) TaxID=979556 RepID=E8NCF9_MICTS|nr:ABC transporter permease subunit [Microbacterium testaceum]BAJ73607.1 ABC-type nitrate/sulfonate/bicarbonate transport system, permease component [Microbacterium testaceum StLB037]
MIRLPAWVWTTLCTLGTAALLLVGWQLAITFSGLSPYLAKTPVDVWRYLFVDGVGNPAEAAERRAALVPMIGVTLGHSAIGLLLGITAGFIGAVALTVSRALRSIFLPLALLLQTVPLIAMAPVIYAVFGSGILTAAVVAAVVTFFPLLMNIGAGLSSSTPETVDLVHAYGGGRWTLLRFVQLPASLPSLFAGLKLAAPATVSAATLYEFLFSFEGLGANLLTSKSYSDYGLLWTLVVITVLLSLAAYGLVVLAETLLLAGRFPPRASTPAQKGLA